MTKTLARSIVTMAPRFISEGFLLSLVCSRPAVVNSEVTMKGLLMVVLSAWVTLSWVPGIDCHNFMPSVDCRLTRLKYWAWSDSFKFRILRTPDV